MSFAALIERSNHTIEKQFSDCRVMFARSAAWADKLTPQGYSGEIISQGVRVQQRGQFSSPPIERDGFEGYAPSVSFPSLVPLKNALWQDGIVQQHDRLAVLQDYTPITDWMVYKIVEVQHDGKGRTFCKLHILGPMCDGDGECKPRSYPTPYGVKRFDTCVDLDRELEHHGLCD